MFLCRLLLCVQTRTIYRNKMHSRQWKPFFFIVGYSSACLSLSFFLFM